MKIHSAVKMLIFALIFLFPNFRNLSYSSPEKIQIVTSVFPLADFVRSVGGDRVEVHILISAGAEVHTWRPRPSDIIKVSHAQLLIYIGSGLEPWMPDFLKGAANSRLRIIESAVGISLLEDHDHSGHNHDSPQRDPHIWLDFQIDQVIVDRIAHELGEISPQDAPLFRKNAEDYKIRLQNLDRRYRDVLNECAGKTMILGGHAAFGYLARRYGLKQVSAYGLSPDAKPSAKQILEIIQLARDNESKTIFFETGVSDEITKLLAKEIGAKTLVLNPGANLTSEQDESGLSFIDLMLKNLENLKNGLNCK